MLRRRQLQSVTRKDSRRDPIVNNLTDALKNIDPALLDAPLTEDKLKAREITHPPRILMLYGSLRALCSAGVALNLPFVAYFAATAPSRGALVALAATYFVAWAYSAPPLRAKGRPGWDSLANAGYVLPFVFACLYLGVPDPPWRETIAFAVWTFGAHAFTSIQDADADRAAGLRTIATTIGAQASALVAIVSYLVAFQLVIDEHPAYATILLLHALIVVWMRRSPRADAPHLAYRVFMALNLAAGFTITVAVALAHPATTRWTAIVMLSLCALVGAAARFARRDRGDA